MTTYNGEFSPSSDQHNTHDRADEYLPTVEQFGPVTADAIRSTPLSEVVGDGREIPISSEDARFPSHIPPEVVSSPDHAAFREQVAPPSSPEARPFRTKTWVKVTALAAPALAAGGIFLVPKVFAENPGDRPAAVSHELKDQHTFPDSVVLSQKFDTLQPDQQARIRGIYDEVKAAYAAGVDPGKWPKLGSRDLLVFKDWVVENNEDRVMQFAAKYSASNKVPGLHPTVEAHPSNTGQQAMDLVSKDWAISLSLVDWSSGKQAQNPDIGIALAASMFVVDSVEYQEWTDAWRDGERSFQIAPMTVLQSKQLPSDETPIWKLATQKQYNDIDGQQYELDTLQCIPFTNIHGERAYAWQMISGVKSKSAPSL